MSTDHKGEETRDVLDWLLEIDVDMGVVYRRVFRKSSRSGLPVRTWRRQEWAGHSVAAAEPWLVQWGALCLGG